jgi:hypothetical protein
MAEQAAVVVATGREVRGVPVGLDRWRAVQDETAGVVEAYGAVFTRDALGHGQWDGRSEESVTVAGAVLPFRVGRVLEAAAAVAEGHEQEAVAVTVGVTVLVGPGDIPDRAELVERLRALADAIDRDRR